MENRDIARLLHIRDAIARIEDGTATGHERLSGEFMPWDAILWRLDVICETLKHLSPNLRERYPGFASDRLRQVQGEFDHNVLAFDLDLALGRDARDTPGAQTNGRSDSR